MRKFHILLFIALFCFSCVLKSQSVQDPDSTSNIQNAEYLKGDLIKLLGNNTRYPVEALKNNLQGDVILSFVINSEGKMENLNVLSAPGVSLYNSTIESFNHLENEWSPCKINGEPVDKEYMLIYRYRMYVNTQPPDYKKRAGKLFEKGKYERALKFYDKAIEENQYDYTLFLSRAKVNEMLGNTEEAEEDVLESKKIRNKILSVVDIAGIAKTVTRKIEGRQIRRF